MRRYIRALMLCTVFAVFSGVYVYSKLFYSDLSLGGNGPRGFIPPRVPGIRRGAVDKTGPQSPHWYNRYIMRQRGQVEAAGGSVQPDAPMHLAVVACGERLEETLTMIKSAVLFSIKHLQLHIFAEDQLHTSFMEALQSWPGFIRSRFNYTVYSISFPSENAAEWKKLFKPCASQRLFLPLILKDIDLPRDRLWAFLTRFNASQLAAMAPSKEPRIAWYNRCPPPLRQDGHQLRRHAHEHDQDEGMFSSNCASAEEDGINILHGNRGVYHDHKQPAFRAVYEAIRKYPFGADPVSSLLDPLEEQLLTTTHTYCGKSHPLLTKRLAHSLANINRKSSAGR
ncbi:hypothetical protein KUCAC02_006401 [Chaenocephalus aceratus]|uniref:Uncharacterized protein n=1 Tax=Chaenocephalus aceratus TaxID=36190 RepID=A0ACB9VSC7_CHAAC|nr:hypothetical protein KUCAC02_006401 [Chaenocephalus aceratus]